MTRGRSDVVEVYLRLPPEQIAFVKFIFESYEGVAVVRTIDPAQAVIVLLIAGDFAPVARDILDSLKDAVRWEELPAAPGEP
jgi:hypothetical protein